MLAFAQHPVAVCCSTMDADQQLRYDKADIREVIESWIIFRDSALWDAQKLQIHQ
jgi:hypothetical protein